MKMPFGKYAGEEIEDIPDYYLRWMDERFDEEEHPDLLAASRQEMEFREKNGIKVKELGDGYVNG